MKTSTKFNLLVIWMLGGLAFTPTTYPQTDNILFVNELLIDSNRDQYLYAPSVFYDYTDGHFKFYGCGGIEGDHIVFKSARTIEGLQHAPWQIALEPSRLPGTFDRIHACDPTVIVVDGVYYLFYGGIDSTLPICQQVTRIGAAVSYDGGKTFERLFDGEPIIREGEWNGQPMRGIYGVGQPAVTTGPDGYFYMIYSEIQSALSPECEDLPWTNGYSTLHLVRCPVPSFAPNLIEHVKSFAGHEFGGVSLDLAYNRGRNQLEVIVNATLGHVSDTAGVRIVHLDLEGNIIPDTFNSADHATVYEARAGFQFGEGIGVIKNQTGEIVPWCEGHGQNKRMHLNFVASTFGNRPNVPVTISGPVRMTRFTEGTDGTVSDWSTVGEKALQGDLDGDSIADQIVVHPLSMIWRWKLSSENFSTTHYLQWGLPGVDTPIIVKDRYGNDGKDEISVFRNGLWYIHESGVWPFAVYHVVNWGLPQDVPFSAKTGNRPGELIVWRPSNGTWYINRSGSWPFVEYDVEQFGRYGDWPQLADINNDGLSDFIVWRNTESAAEVKLRSN